MKIAQLTPAQKNAISGQIFDEFGSVYNPVQDANGVWCISQAEIDNTTVAAFLWVKELPLSDYQTPPSPPFPL